MASTLESAPQSGSVNRISARLADGEIINFDESPNATEILTDPRDLPLVVPASQVRIDEILSEWVGIAGHRQTRMYQPPADACPLCPSTPENQSEIPSPDYDVVVFENRFPSLGGSGNTAMDRDMFDARPGHGRCEVVCFTSGHNSAMIYSAAAHRALHGSNLFGDVTAGELADGSRIVATNALWVPFAARWPVEVHLYLRRHARNLTDLDAADRDALAALHLQVLHRMEGTVADTLPAITSVHQAPVHAGEADYWLHLEILSIRRDVGKLKFLAGRSPRWARSSTTSPRRSQLRRCVKWLYQPYPRTADDGAGRRMRRERPRRRREHPVSAADLFRHTYSREPLGVFSAPGRVNLIGEHTDYTGGLVLPFAIDARAGLGASPGDAGVVRVVSAQRPAMCTPFRCATSTPVPRRATSWVGYLLGAVWAFGHSGHKVRGFDLALDSHVPAAAGLSSSAAVECITALAVSALTGGGFRGSVITLLASNLVEEVIDAVTSAFADRGFQPPVPRLVRPAAGACGDS